MQGWVQSEQVNALEESRPAGRPGCINDGTSSNRGNETPGVETSTVDELLCLRAEGFSVILPSSRSTAQPPLPPRVEDELEEKGDSSTKLTAASCAERQALVALLELQEIGEFVAWPSGWDVLAARAEAGRPCASCGSYC